MKLQTLTEDVIDNQCGRCVAACCRYHDLIEVLKDDNTPDEYCNSSERKRFMKMVPDPVYGGKKCICLGPDNRCTIYDKRSTTCRNFKMGGEACKYVQKVFGLR